ncbi:MAG: hypothetical protein K2Z81_23615 [Cyanobacteria bacterium]|nr:hypothetical protein [Cyanobacteriota bacterium]
MITIQHDCSIGDSISLAIRNCRKDVRFLIKQLWWPSVIELIGKVLFMLASQKALEVSHYATPQLDILFQIMGLFLLGILFAAPAEVWMTVRQLAYVRMLVLNLDDYEKAAAQVHNKFWAVIVYVILFYLEIFIWVFLNGFVMAVIMTVLGFVTAPPAVNVIVLLGIVAFFFVSLFLLFMPLSLVFAVLACEDQGIFDTLGKATSLTFKKLPRVFAFSIVLLLVFLAVHFALTSVVQVIYFIEYMRAGVYSGQRMAAEVQLPLYAQVIGCAWQSITNMFSMPMLFVSSGFFYYSLRTREEGLDLLSGVNALRTPNTAKPS